MWQAWINKPVLDWRFAGGMFDLLTKDPIWRVCPEGYNDLMDTLFYGA